MGDAYISNIECDSENSIVEVEVPRKPSPPLIEIEEDDFYLNVTEGISLVSNKKVSPVVPESDIVILTSDNETDEARTDFSSPDHWTSDMIKFYNEDWGNESNFIVEKIQQQMDKTPLLWQISMKDCRSNQSRGKKIYCNNCCQPGHVASRCTEPPYEPVCHMCGKKGHFSDRCPQSICLNCGAQTRCFVVSCFKCQSRTSQVCSRCSMKGHSYIHCPDHWRLFHLTTNTENVIVPPKNIHKKEEDVWCCNCSRKGHFYNNCPISKSLCGFTDTVPYVVAYSKYFGANQKKSSRRKRKGKKKEPRILKLNPMNKTIGKIQRNSNKKLARELSKIRRNQKWKPK